MTAFRMWRYTRRVKNRRLDQSLLLSQLKYLVADMFRLDILEPDKIADDEPLIGNSLCLDSLDVLELAICVEEEFGIAIRSGEESHSVFTSIASLADFIHARAQTISVRPYSPMPAWIAPTGLRAVAIISNP
jgi:acyl carrier protein